MEQNKKPLQVENDLVISLEYELTVDGEIIDSTEGEEPIEFIQGLGQIIPGLENALYGMSSGDNKKIVVPAKDGYGELDPEAVVDVPRSEFPDDIPLKPGVELQMEDADGDIVHAQVVSIGKNTVKLDFNHPLAGKELHFDVTVVDLRMATKEELDHGHVHGSDGEDYEDDDLLFDYEDLEDEMDEDEDIDDELWFDEDDDDLDDEDEIFDDED